MDKKAKLKELSLAIDAKYKNIVWLERNQARAWGTLIYYESIFANIGQAIAENKRSILTKYIKKMPSAEIVFTALGLADDWDKAYFKACNEHDKLCNKFGKLNT